MSDELLTKLVVLVDVAIPLALITAFVRVLELRKHVVVVLGALSPIYAFYVVVVCAFVLNPTDPNNRFAFYAGWVMTFVAVLGSLATGLLLAFVRRPTRLWARYVFGCSVPTIYFVLYMATAIMSR